MSNIPPRLLKMIDDIIKAEGGFVNDPKDRGGATRWGITFRTLGQYRKLGRPATVAEVKALTKAEAREIYYKQYILRPNIDEIENEKIQEAVADFGVNSGPGRAIKILQRMCNDIEGKKVLTEDGMLGHHSLELINKYGDLYTELFLASYGYLRIKFLIAITNNNPDNKRFIRGWTKRVNKFIPSPHKFDLTLLDQYVK